MTQSIVREPQSSTPSQKQRYFALDVLRGMTIALMIVVNNPGSWGSIYAPFEHSAWHGFTLTDLVFPTFLFVIGNAASFSLRKYERQSEAAFLKKVFRRTFLIFFIGLFLAAFPFVYRDGGEFIFKNLAHTRIMGVLQRIALCYCLGSLIIHYFKLRGALIAGVIILLGYWWILWFFGDHPDPYSLEGNAVLKLDLTVLGKENLWQGFGIRFDPEGLLSTLPAIVNVIAGYAAGVFVQKSGNTMKTVLQLAIAGLALLIIAKVWSVYFPINKGIWTSTFVLFSSGWDLLILGALILIIEIWKFKKWTYFFEAFGKNPLFIYVLSGLVVMLLAIIRIDGQSPHALIYKNLYLSWLSPLNASLAFAFVFMLSMWVVGYVLDRNKIYVKV